MCTRVHPCTSPCASPYIYPYYALFSTLPFCGSIAYNLIWLGVEKASKRLREVRLLGVGVGHEVFGMAGSGKGSVTCHILFPAGVFKVSTACSTRYGSAASQRRRFNNDRIRHFYSSIFSSTRLWGRIGTMQTINSRCTRFIYCKVYLLKRIKKW